MLLRKTCLMDSYILTELETAILVTELVDDPDCFEKMTVLTCEYGKELVVNNAEEGRIKCVDTVGGHIPGEKNKDKNLELGKRKLCDLFERNKEPITPGNNACSITSQSTNEERYSTRVFESDGKPCMLSYASCDEPGESTQVSALEFVDHFLLSNNVNISQVTNGKKTIRDITPPVSRIKGPQILAKRLVSRAPIEETRTYEWVDFYCQEKNGNFLGKENEKSFDYGVWEDVTVSEHHKLVDLDNKEEIAIIDNCIQKEEFLDIQMITNISTSLDPILEVPLKYIKGMELGPTMETEHNLDDLNGKLTDQQTKGIDSENNAALFDIDTQIAAEVMEALSSARSPVSFNLVDYYHGSEKALDYCRGMRHNKAYSEQTSRPNCRKRRRQGTFQSSSSKPGNAAASISGHGQQPKTLCNQNLPKLFLSKPSTWYGFPDSESTSNLTRKDLRRPRAMAVVRVLFSQHLDNYIIKQQRRVVAQLGVSIASSSTDATHFIADKFARTMNMLEAIALGKPVVTHLWLQSCGQASCFIDEKNYIMRDPKKEREIGFSMPASLARARKHPLLEGYKVLITHNIKPSKDMILCLVKAVFGQPVERSQITLGKDEMMQDGLIIISCEEDYEQCLPFLQKGAAVYSSEFLLNGIIIQKLEHERHRLFNNQVKRGATQSRRQKM